MSCRPRGPSDRPLYYVGYDPEAGGAGAPDGHAAPRLPTQTIAGRALLVALAVCCCGAMAIGTLFVCSLVAQLELPARPVVAIDASSTNNGGARDRRHAQRSVLQRLAMLRRAAPPAHGVDLATVDLAFPHWRVRGTGEWDVPAALSDMTLALSYLAQEDGAEREGA